jgi:hypothetical protein
MKKVTVQLVDDLDGSVIEEDAGRTVFFAFEGEAFEIDLSDANAQRLRDLLDPYVSAARKAQVPVGQLRRAIALPIKNPELQVIRAWARENGIVVSDRGRIAATIRDAYIAAHQRPE